MKWKKQGIVYCPDGSVPWSKSHAMAPTPVRISEEIIRVFVTFCDENMIGRTGFVDVLASNPAHVIHVSSQPVLDIGKAGTFDENGVLTCSVAHVGQHVWHMYYAGFELGTKIRYRLLTGLAISYDNAATFQRVQQTPVLERSDKELYFRGGPYCMVENGKFRLWYVAGSEWLDLNEKPMPIYDLRYVESPDGINFPLQGKVHLAVTETDEHGFGRPCVIAKPGGGYRLFYSIRRKSLSAYRLGYAESPDGFHWTRMDGKLNLDISPGSFDSDAIMYAAPIQVGNKLHVFYNGNDFGRYGFAIASLEE